MEQRHLLPDEFEDLLDGSETEETTALRAHVEHCSTCRAEMNRLGDLSRALDHLPHHGPAPLFAYRVMSQVQVFEPWHVALRDSVRRLIPRSPAARWTAGVSAALVAMVLTFAGVWVALNNEKAWLFADVGVRRIRGAVFGTARGLIESVFGRDALAAIEGSGATGAAIAFSVLVAVVLIAAIGFRVAALTSRRRRS